MDKTYVNSTEGVLASRNPRLALKPGDSLLITPEMMSYSIRMWIRNGSLLLEQAEAVAAHVDVDGPAAEPVAAKPARKPAAKKPGAKKVAVKK